MSESLTDSLNALQKLGESKELRKIDEALKAFNAFEVLGIERDEYRHSNVLAWLLNPNANHNLGSKFLELFLKDFKEMNANNLDLKKFRVIREYECVGKRIDILLDYNDGENKRLIVVENKIGSQEGEKQLCTYYDNIQRKYAEYSNKFFIYLTPEGDKPFNEEDKNCWKTYGYKSVLKNIKKLIPSNHIEAGVADFLKYYKSVIGRHVLMDENESIKKAVNKLYYEHRKALDLIFEYRSDALIIVKMCFDKLMDTYEQRIDKKEGSSNREMRFWSKRLKVEYENALQFRIFNEPNKNVDLHLYVGPCELQKLREIYEKAQKNTDLFNQISSDKPSELPKECSLYKFSLLSKEERDNGDLNEDQIEKILSGRFQQFIDRLEQLEDSLLIA
jgi:hypothetical protein